jgi:hypothetical protein
MILRKSNCINSQELSPGYTEQNDLIMQHHAGKSGCR